MSECTCEADHYRDAPIGVFMDERRMGSCNFCSRANTAKRVYVVSAGGSGTLQVRFCERCLSDLGLRPRR